MSVPLDPPLTLDEKTALAAGRLTESVEVLGAKVDGLQGELKKSNEQRERAEKLSRARLRGIVWCVGLIAVLILGLGALGGWIYSNASDTDQRFDTYTSQAVINCGVRNQQSDATRSFIRFFRSLVRPEDHSTLQAIDAFLMSIPPDLDCSKLKV